MLFALGACPAVKAGNAEEVFSCPVNNGAKQVLVTLEGDMFSYRFGTEKTADLELTAELDGLVEPYIISGDRTASDEIAELIDTFLSENPVNGTPALDKLIG